MSAERLAVIDDYDTMEAAVLSDDLIHNILKKSRDPLAHFIALEQGRPGCILSKMDVILTFIISSSFYQHRMAIIDGLPRFGTAFGDVIREYSNRLHSHAFTVNDKKLLDHIRFNYPVDYPVDHPVD